MGISFWHKKKEEPQAPKAVPENGVNAVKRSDTESDAPGGVRLRRIAVGAAVILSAIVIAGPFVVSERAVKAESPAKTEISSPPAVSQAAQAQPASAAVATAAMPQLTSSPAAASPAASATVPAAPGAAQPMAQAAPSTQQAPAAAVPQSQTQADIAKAKLAADNAAKARMKAAQEENARQRAEIEQKAKAAKAALDDQLQAAIAQQQKKEAAAKKASADASQQRWVIPVGAFSDPAAAKKVVANGRGNGVSLSTSSVKSGSTTLTRVTAGPFKTRDQAEAAEAKLAMAGIRTGGVHQAK